MNVKVYTPRIVAVDGHEGIFVRELNGDEHASLEKHLRDHAIGFDADPRALAASRAQYRDLLMAAACCDKDGNPAPAPAESAWWDTYFAARKVNGLFAGIDGEFADWLAANPVQEQIYDLSWHFGEPDVEKFKAKYGTTMILCWLGWRTRKAANKEEISL